MPHRNPQAGRFGDLRIVEDHTKIYQGQSLWCKLSPTRVAWFRHIASRTARRLGLDPFRRHGLSTVAGVKGIVRRRYEQPSSTPLQH